MSIFCRTLNIKCLLDVQRSLNLTRVLSAQTAVKSVDQKHETTIDVKPYESIPTLSIFETLRRFFPGGKYYNVNLMDVHLLMKSEFGNILKMKGMLGRPDMLMLYSPEDFETVFRNEGIYPIRPGLQTLHYYRKNLRPDIYGEYGGLASEQGEDWQKFRSLVNPIIVKPQTVKLYVPQVDEIAKEFIELIGQKRDDKNEVPANFSDYVNMWSLETIACITLDRRLGLLDENNKNEDGNKFISLVRQFFEQSVEFEAKPSVWRYYHTKGFKNLMELYHKLYELALKLVEESIEKMKNEPEKPENEKSVLEKLSKINSKVAVVMSADSIMAGVDTTASAFVGALYCLAKNPEKQEKLREEIKKVLTSKSDSLTADKMRNLPYLRAVIKEGLRIYPPVIGTVRQTTRDIVLSGYNVPKGIDVLVGAQFSAKDDKNFDRANEFIPERWFKDNNDPQCPHAKDAHPFSYMPFGFGARTCVGRRFAELELEAMLMRIVRNFKVEWHHPDLKIKGTLVNLPENDMKFRLIDI